MSAPRATVAIPVRDGGSRLESVLSAVRAQQLDGDLELLVADSGSTDGSRERAERHGARVLAVAPAEFSHGGTRNLLVGAARAPHVALLTQDAVPASRTWLAALLGAFATDDDVGLAFGPYLAAPGATLAVERELREWFGSFGGPRLDRLAPGERDRPAGELLGPRAFFTDANGCVARAAWERVPFRAAPYAEDHLLALDMLRAGYAKAYVPEAAVVHSHAYGAADQLRRAFDEARGLREVYGWAEPLSLGRFRAVVLGRALGDARAAGVALPPLASVRHHTLRYAGAVLGGRADRLAPALRRHLSLERRASFVPADPADREH